MTRKERARRSVAIHEAGHSVVSIVTRRRFKYVTIVPADDSAGHVRYPAPKYDAPLEAHFDFLMRSLAGYLAELQHGFRPQRCRWEGDRQSAADHALDIAGGDGEEAGLWIKLATKRADRILTIWRASVVALADRLLVEPKLSWEEARRTVLEARGVRVD